VSLKTLSPNAITLREFLLLKVSRFSLQLLGTMLALSVVLLVVVFWYENSIMKQDIAAWLEKNQPRVEQALFLENTLGVDGMLAELERVDRRIESVRIVPVSGEHSISYFGTLPSGVCKWFGEHKLGFKTDFFNVRVCYRSELRFADRMYGSLELSSRFNVLALTLYSIACLALGLFLFILIRWAAERFISDLKISIVNPLSDFARTLRQRPNDLSAISKVTSDGEAFRSAPREVLDLIDSYNQLISRIYELSTRERERVELVSYQQVARQVVHDIRSPLTALKMVSATLADLPEAQRTLIRSAVQRIDDIAMSLQVRRHETPQAKVAGMGHVESVADLVETLVFEKRVEFSNYSGFNIHVDLQNAYGLFAILDGALFKRQLSNIINNAVEASNGAGAIHIAVADRDGQIAVDVSDRGKGIPSEILGRLGREAVSFGKRGHSGSGQGIGLLHVRKFLDSIGGELRIDTCEGSGTTVTMLFPPEPAPDWFPKSLRIEKGCRIIMVDDDPSIHEVWRERFKQDGIDSRVEAFHFYSPEEFLEWQKSAPALGSESNTTYLFDYEFKGSRSTGLDLVERLKERSGRVFLVTSRYDDGVIQRRLASRGLRLLPKSLATHVPLH